MKVNELVELLSAHDPNAEVSAMTQPHYPHEHRIGGIATRADCRGYEETYVPLRQGEAPGDVILVEGAWLRYGIRAAWRAARSRQR